MNFEMGTGREPLVDYLSSDGYQILRIANLQSKHSGACRNIGPE
jgi:hypothetical protein